MPPTSTRKDYRQYVAKRFYKPRHPIVSATTSDSTTTTLIDSVLSPSAQDTNYLKAWVRITEQTPVDSGGDTAEAVDISETVIDVDVSTGFTIGDMVKIDSEVMGPITAKNTVATDITVARAAQGTTAATHTTGKDIYIVGPAVGETARVTNTNFSGTTSTLTVAPAFSTTPYSGTDYELHYKYHPSYAEDLIGEVMGNLEVSYLIPPTLLTNGDFETAVSTEWTASSATLADETTIVLHGRRAMKITASAANGQAQSAAVAVPPNTQTLVAADVFIASGDSAKLTLAASSTTGGTYTALETAESDSSGWVHLEFTKTTGSTDEYVKVYLESQANGDITYWDNAILLLPQQNFYTPPNEAEYAHDFGKLYYYPKGADIPGTNNDYATRVFEGKPEHFCHYTVERDDTAVVPMRIVLERTPITHPLWLECDVDFAALSDDTTTSTAPKELVGQLVLGELYDDWADEEEEMGNAEAATALRASAMRARTKVAGDFHNFRKVRTVTKGALR